MRSLLKKKNNSFLSIDNELLIYESVLLPVIRYRFAALTMIKGYNLDRLRAIQNKILRTIGNFPWNTWNFDIHHDFLIPSISRHIRDLLTGGTCVLLLPLKAQVRRMNCNRFSPVFQT